MAAVAMGARAVFVGQPALWALAATGQEAVDQVITRLTDELANVAVQLGTPTADQLTADLIVP